MLWRGRWVWRCRAMSRLNCYSVVVVVVVDAVAVRPDRRTSSPGQGSHRRGQRCSRLRRRWPIKCLEARWVVWTAFAIVMKGGRRGSDDVGVWCCSVWFFGTGFSWVSEG